MQRCGKKALHRETRTQFARVVVEAPNLVSLEVDHSSLRPLCVATVTEQLGFGQAKDTDGRCWAEGGVASRDPSTHTHFSYIAVAPAAFLAPRLTHDWEHQLLSKENPKSGRLLKRSLPKPSLHWKQRPPPPVSSVCFFSLCVLTVTPLKNNWTFLCTAPRP